MFLGPFEVVYVLTGLWIDRLLVQHSGIMDVTESKPYFNPSKVILRLHELSVTNRKAAEDFVETRWPDC